MARSSVFRSVLTYAGVALSAGSISLALWVTGLLATVQGAFLFPRENAALNSPSFWIATAIFYGVSLAVAIDVGRFGGRRSFLYVSGGLLVLAGVSLFASWLLFFDVLFAPIALAGAISALAMQMIRLCQRDNAFSKKLFASSQQFENAQPGAEDGLQSGLQLLDTVMSPLEAVVFRYGNDGLVSSARLRAAQNNSLDTGRNSAWRDGVRLCERAIRKNQTIVEKIASEESNTIVALPLRHEDRTVGALLVRLGGELDDDYRPLLAAIGGQMARNLQREEAHQSNGKRGALGFFSAKDAARKLEALYVLNGALLEQSSGIRAVSEIGDGVALVSLDGRIGYANAVLSELAGIPGDQIRSHNFFGLLDRFRTDVFDEPAIAVRRVLQTGEAYERELHYSERSVSYNLRISLLFQESQNGNSNGSRKDSSSEPLCLALVVKDITLLKEYEKLRSDMLSLMSHELRTPITSINGFAELLTADESLSEQTREFVTIIANESQRLSRMINTFLTVTQLQRKDRQEVLKIPLRLDEVVKETIAGLQKVAKKRRIRLVEQPTQRLPPVAADKSMITQAIKNLVSNAIKYSPERTTVTVSTALEAEAVRLSVEDRGYGIPAEAKDRVWEKFYRVVREGQEKDEESTGLGLSFVREVIEHHGGTVDLDTEVGRGSKFSFTLPRL